MLIYLLTLSFQINRMFPITDVMHLVEAKTPNPKIIYVEGNIVDFKSMITSANIPTHATLSYKSDRIHIFVHDCNCITRCIWEGNISFDEKKEIVNNMIKWWFNGNNKLFNHRLVKYEDGLIFTEVLEELNLLN